jgi:Uma2 family endonuclease
MSALPTSRHITIEQFELLPEIDGIQELLDGEVVEMPPPKQRHSALVKRIVKILSRHIDESRTWIETGFLIGPHCPQPDVAIIHVDQEMERGWYSGSPLIAIEVASRGNSPNELEFKKELYLAHGAQEVWIVYDKTRTVEWYGPGGVNRTFRTPFQSPHLDAEIDPAEIFA